jgi:hypothetical protein
MSCCVVFVSTFVDSTKKLSSFITIHDFTDPSFKTIIIEVRGWLGGDNGHTQEPEGQQSNRATSASTLH